MCNSTIYNEKFMSHNVSEKIFDKNINLERVFRASQWIFSREVECESWKAVLMVIKNKLRTHLKKKERKKNELEYEKRTCLIIVDIIIIINNYFFDDICDTADGVRRRVRRDAPLVSRRTFCCLVYNHLLNAASNLSAFVRSHHLVSSVDVLVLPGQLFLLFCVVSSKGRPTGIAHCEIFPANIEK